MIDFGKYDKKISFQTYQDVEDGFGGSTPTYSVILLTFARTLQMGSSNNLESLQLTLPKTYKVGIMYRNGFNPDERYQILYDGFLHTLTGVELNKERQRKEWIITMVRGDRDPSGAIAAELEYAL